MFSGTAETSMFPQQAQAYVSSFRPLVQACFSCRLVTSPNEIETKVGADSYLK